MEFLNTELEKVKADLNLLDEVMSELGLVRADQWDYERVSYDRKYELKEGVFYLRVQGVAIDGDVGAHKATIQLLTPILGKHYYPHGVEYGDDEFFPEALIKQCEALLKEVKTAVDQITTV